MPITQRNTPLLHRKEWQMMAPAPAGAGAGALFIYDQTGNSNVAMYFTALTNHWFYYHDEDSYTQIPSGAFAGTVGSGACGIYHPWSINYTANGGSTSTVTVLSTTHNITGLAKGATIEFISSGINSGLRRTITDVITNAGAGNVTLVLDSAVPTAVLNTHTFRLSSGRFYVMNAGTIATGIWKVFDVATLAWQANLATANLPTSWGTDGKLACAYALDVSYATGTATAGASTTLTNSAKTWTVNQWTNYQVRITGGTGIGQVRTIASNTNTVLTVGTAWTTTPDATSQYAIEGNEDFLYLLGNNAVTMYRYSISANTWAVMAPTTARALAPVGGMSADVVIKTGNNVWADENAILDGRYIYSMRGGTGALIDRFDIAGGTAGAGAWANVVYQGAEVFGSGSNASVDGSYIYIRKDATNRFFKYSITGNYLEPLSVNFVADSATAAGQKLWVKNLDSTGTVKWLYSLGNSLTLVYRLMLY
jgi:hypothetical protein